MAEEDRAAEQARSTPRLREVGDRELFDRIADTYARKDEARSSRAARRHRLQSTLEAVALPPRPDLLEVGCGTGYALHYLPFDVGSYLGVDHSAELVAIARDRHSAAGVSFEAGRVQDLAVESSFDCVFVIGVLHHLEDVETALSTMVAALRPGGWLVVNEPQPSNRLVSAARWLRKRVDRTYSHDQVEFAAGELVDMFGAAGLTAITTAPQGYLSTPFAEVPLPLPVVTERLSRLAVRVDTALARRRVLPGLAWNCVAAGRRP